MYCDPNEPKSTSYTSTMKGLQVGGDVRAKILDDCRTSFVGQIIPDPTLMGKFALYNQLADQSRGCTSKMLASSQAGKQFQLLLNYS